MKQLKIINETYYKLLIGILCTLILYNIYTIIATGNIIGILPILIESVLIYCLVTKNSISQKAIEIWIIVAFFVAQGLKIIGTAMQSLAKYIQGEEGAIEMLTSDKIIYSVIFVIVGIIIWIVNRDFGEITVDKELS